MENRLSEFTRPASLYLYTMLEGIIQYMRVSVMIHYNKKIWYEEKKKREQEQEMRKKDCNGSD